MPTYSPQFGCISALQCHVGTEVPDLGLLTKLRTLFCIHPDLRVPQDGSHMFPRPIHVRIGFSSAPQSEVLRFAEHVFNIKIRR